MFDVFSAAFAFRGRIGRGSYWGLTILCMLALFGSSVSVALTANYTNATPVNVIAVVVAIVGAVFFLVMCIVLFGTGVCRLRDRGKSGFWIILYYLAPFALALLAIDPDGQRESLDWVALAVLGWAIIDLGILEGKAVEPVAA
jgi:uncharacterized membrane protein YhaH (DUF805 family)